jgi:hypothetical protein
MNCLVAYAKAHEVTLPVIQSAAETTKARAGSAGRKLFVVACANNYMHMIYITKPDSKVNRYFWAKLCDFSRLKPPCGNTSRLTKSRARSPEKGFS